MKLHGDRFLRSTFINYYKISQIKLRLFFFLKRQPFPVQVNHNPIIQKIIKERTILKCTHLLKKQTLQNKTSLLNNLLIHVLQHKRYTDLIFTSSPKTFENELHQNPPYSVMSLVTIILA